MDNEKAQVKVSIPFTSETEDIYNGPWVLAYSDEGKAGYGVNYGPEKLALFFESYEMLCQYWDRVKDRKKGVRARIDAYPLSRPESF